MQPPSASVNGALCVLGAGFGIVRKVTGSVVGRKWLLLLALICMPGLLFGQTAPPATYYVATTGSDSNNGTSPTTPFATITHALSLCTGGGQTVAVASGTYSTVTFTRGTTGAVVHDTLVRTSAVTVFGWGATQPLISAPSGSNYAIYSDGGSFVTYENFALRSENNVPLVEVTWSYGPHTPDSHDITIEDCDLSDPDTADSAQTTGNPTIIIGYGSYNVTVEECTIHDSETGIGGPGEPAGPEQCNNINLLDNTLNNFTGDAIQFGSWNNVTIDGNVITNIADAPGSTFHNDGIQFTGNTQNATITHNFIAHSDAQLMLIGPTVGPVNNVLVENNVIWDAGGFAVQSSGATQVAFVNNTIFKSLDGGLLLRSDASTVPNDTVVANNSLCGLGYYGGASSAYENYNYLPSGQGSGANDIFGTNPDYVNTSIGNFHPASGSPLLGAGVESFSATVDGVLTNCTAPTDDLDFLTRGNPPAIGAYDTMLGNDTIAYCGFDYSSTGHVGSLTDGTTDFGWSQTTWSGNDNVVSPGLTYDYLPSLGLALSFGSSVAADQTINTADFPPGYGVGGSDGVTRLGAAGTTVWVSFLLDPTESDLTNTLTCGVNLEGQGTGGVTKLTIGDIGTNGGGNWAISDPVYGGGYAVSSVPIAQNTTTFLVAEIQFVAGTNNDVVNLWVNPPLGKTPPTPPTVSLTGHDISPFGVVEFKGSRTSIGDEVSVGTSWLSVTSGGSPEPY